MSISYEEIDNYDAAVLEALTSINNTRGHGEIVEISDGFVNCRLQNGNCKFRYHVEEREDGSLIVKARGTSRVIRL